MAWAVSRFGLQLQRIHQIWRRDLDNLLKALLDALQHAGLYEDDTQAESILIERGAVVQGGAVAVNITTC